jgi:hypothetical protein
MPVGMDTRPADSGTLQSKALHFRANQTTQGRVVEIVTLLTNNPWGRFFGLTIVAIFCFAGSIWSVPASGSTVNGVKVAHPVNRHGSVVKGVLSTLGNCPFATVNLRVLIARTSYNPSQPVDVLGVARNEGPVSCTYAGTERGDQFIGPCGALSMSVLDGSGTSVWPGPVAYSCPEMGPTHLGPGAQVIAIGSWPRLTVTRAGSSPAPSGTYRLVIANRLSFTITLGGNCLQKIVA